MIHILDTGETGLGNRSHETKRRACSACRGKRTYARTHSFLSWKQSVDWKARSHWKECGHHCCWGWGHIWCVPFCSGGSIWVPVWTHRSEPGRMERLGHVASRSFLNRCFWASMPQGVWGERGALTPGANLLALLLVVMPLPASPISLPCLLGHHSFPCWAP